MTGPVRKLRMARSEKEPIINFEVLGWWVGGWVGLG